MLKLSQLKIGSSGVVAHLDGANRLVARMMELGFVPGALVEVTRKAPLGDPVQYLIRGARISIRMGEAACVQVVPKEATVAHTTPVVTETLAVA